MILQNKRLTVIIITVLLLLLIPLIAMQFTDEVIWDLMDFFAAGVLLFGTAFLCELVIRNVKKTGNRILICLTILLVFILVWGELAVGIFGTPFGGS